MVRALADQAKSHGFKVIHIFLIDLQDMITFRV